MTEIHREVMKEPIERLFEREFPSQYGTVHMPESTGDRGRDAIDVLYVEKSKNGLHVVRIENTYDDCMFNLDGGIHTAADIPANLHWIALPLDTFRDGEEAYSGIMEQTCRERGLGIICVQPKGRGLSAKPILEPRIVPGRFFKEHPRVKEMWNEAVEDDLLAEGYQVVDYR